MKIDYEILLKSPKWFEKRETILQRDGNRCRNCGSTQYLQVHHRQYQIKVKTGNFILPWKYDYKYLITLCNKCHENGHANYKVPIFKINN